MKSPSSEPNIAIADKLFQAFNYSRRRIAVIQIFFAALLIAIACGCSAQSSTSATANSPSGDYKGPPTPCDKELVPSDVAGLLAAPISINHYSMAAGAPGEGCEFGSGAAFTAFVDIAAKKSFVNTGVERTVVQRFADLSSTLIHPARKTLPGVGEEAYDFGVDDSNVPNAKDFQIMARKGAVICVATLTRHQGAQGDSAVIPKSSDDIAKKLGGLCNKVFAARS